LSTERDGSDPAPLDPDAAPTWLKHLVANTSDVPRAYRRRVPAEVLAAITAANATATVTGSKRDAAVPVFTALREAREETGIDTSRLQPLATLDRLFIPPSRFYVVPVLAYSSDPGPVGVVDPGETAIVARVPVRAFINPDNRLMVCREQNTRRFAGPAFLLNQMLVWGFTGQVISALLDVAGWAKPWNTDDIRELDAAMALVRGASGYGNGQQ